MRRPRRSSTFDDDIFIDYRARRPMLELRDGVNTGSCGRRPSCTLGRDADGHDVLLLSGPEPDMAWHRFATPSPTSPSSSASTAMVALGAYPFAAPHTRPPRLSATSPSADVLAALPFRTARSTCPAGMAAALEQRVHERGIPALGIWAQVPHYVASMSYPAASVALLDGLATATGIACRRRRAAPRGGAPARAARPARRRQRRAPGDGRPARAALRRRRGGRRSRRPTTRPARRGELELRSGDELAAEVERFLRDQGKS